MPSILRFLVKDAMTRMKNHGFGGLPFLMSKALNIRMSIENLTSEQRAALIDFAVLAMYADGHLALRENSAMNKILITLGYDEELDRDRELDLSISRVRNHAGNKEKSMEYIRQASGAFNTTEGREKIQSMLLEMMSSDDKVTPEEESFLRTVTNLMGK